MKSEECAYPFQARTCILLYRLKIASDSTQKVSGGQRLLQTRRIVIKIYLCSRTTYRSTDSLSNDIQSKG